MEVELATSFGDSGNEEGCSTAVGVLGVVDWTG